MTHLAVLLLSLLAFMALALAKKRHYKDVFKRPPAPATMRRLRVAGWSALALALGIVVGREGLGLGLVIYSGHTTLAAGLVLGGLIAHGRRSAGTAPHRQAA
jgi:hypothetical protein